MEGVFEWVARYGYAGIFLALVLGIVGLPIPDETLLVFCGYLKFCLFFASCLMTDRFTPAEAS